MTIRIVAALVGAVCLSSLQIDAPSAHAKPHRQPNILVILVDDLGYGDVSSYGAKDLQSPNIDKLVRSGVRLNNFYANCCVCSPTRAALLTGQYPDLVGVPGVIRTHDRSNWGFLDPAAVTLPDVLRKAGYHTAIVGKWHLGLTSPNLPTERGFDHFHGFLGDMMDDYYHHRRHGNNYMRIGTETIDPKGHATDLFSQWASDYIRERADAKQPFFLYLAYNAPHTPIQPPDDWLKKVQDREKGISPKRAKLVALIEHLDHGIGQVMKTLAETGQERNTFVVFTSDNGGQLEVGANNGPLRSGKTHMYEGGIKVAFAAVWPGRIQPGSRSDARALTMDLYPTLAAAVGATFDHAVDGRDILPTLLGETQDLTERDEHFMWLQGGRKEAVRRGDWKLVRDRPDGDTELFDLQSDPKEQQDLSPTQREIASELGGKMKRHREQANQSRWRRPGQK